MRPHLKSKIQNQIEINLEIMFYDMKQKRAILNKFMSIQLLKVNFYSGEQENTANMTFAFPFSPVTNIKK